MLEHLIGLAVMLAFDAGFYVLGVVSVVTLICRDDHDLYCVWMHRREERKRRK